MLLSSIRNDEIAESNGIEGEGYLVRSVFGRETTDFRVTAIAVGPTNGGGLAKLSIRGNNHCCGVTDIGLEAIARGCPTLRDLTLWNVSFVGDKGLSEISLGYHLLEKLDLFQCPTITDKSLLDIVKNCRAVTTLTIDSCSNIGNDSLKAVGQYCLNLKIVVLKICPLIRDHGIAVLFYLASNVLTEVRLQGLCLSDLSLGILFNCCTKLETLSLVSFIGVEDYPLIWWLLVANHLYLWLFAIVLA
uniref:Ein3-binding f-box protein 3 n=1 Tax=Solanum tuberosum TaxID=4113 RepID=M1DUZ7_SOLTU